MAIDSTESTVYKLRRFTNSSDDDFRKALRIYVENTDLNIVTNTNEIIYGLDFYNRKFLDADFAVVGFYMNKVVIGYGQFIYFKQEKLVFIDYLVIDKAYRKNNTFYEFTEKLKEYFHSNNYQPMYVVAEVSTQGALNEQDYSPKTRNLIRLLKMNNFGLINSPYFQPSLGGASFESNLPAVLMLYPADEYQTLKKESFLLILKTIYFKHYGRWYTMILSENDAHNYGVHLHNLYSQVIEKLKNIITIPLDSYSGLSDEKSIQVPERPHKTVLFFFLGFLLLLVFLGGVSFLMKLILNIEYKDQSTLLIFTSMAYLALLSFYSKKASGILNKAVEKVVEKIT